MSQPHLKVVKSGNSGVLPDTSLFWEVMSICEISGSHGREHEDICLHTSMCLSSYIVFTRLVCVAFGKKGVQKNT
jgi:hypothetical protein